MEMEQVTFTTLVFTSTGGIAPESQVYHKRLADRTPVNQERRGLLIYDVLDKNQNLMLNIGSRIANSNSSNN